VPKKEEPEEKELKGDELALKTANERKYYQECSSSRRSKWVECYEAYMSLLDETKNPFLSNLFIPKTHEAVELLSAFLAGPNQSIQCEAEGVDDTAKARVAEKLLEFQWRKVLGARQKIVTWIKQMLCFGDGVMKVGWDISKNRGEGGVPFMAPVSLPDIYMDYFSPTFQSSPSVIHRIVKNLEDIKSDKRYNDGRNHIIPIGAGREEEELTQFSQFDDTVISESKEAPKGELLERWTLKRVVTTGNTVAGTQVLRNIPNPYGFIPFVKVRCKASPLPNRAYDIGGIEPTLKLNKAFNDMVNEVFDNVSLINNKQWFKRRGAKINPMDLVRRPGGVITVDDINTDLKAEEIGDIKPSALEMLKILDNEFQQASMVVNLLKGVPGAEFATEAVIGQQNVQTLLDQVDGNIKDALSELGQMILALNLKFLSKKQLLKITDNEKESVFLEFDPKEIDGKYDVRISADRSAIMSKAVRQKQFVDFLNITGRDESLLQQYPDFRVKLYKKWLEEAGFGDVDSFFEKPKEVPAAGAAPGMVGPGAPRLPAPGQQLTPEAIRQALMASAMPRLEL
jgi:hypothetical protein